MCADLRKSLFVQGVKVEVVREFKLLGVIVDDQLNFNAHVKSLKSSVNRKVFSTKKVFFLPFQTKLQYFKSFVLPHFDYCSSLFVYFSPTLVASVARFYDHMVFNLLGVNVSGLPPCEQQSLLEPHGLFSFYFRMFYRFSLFSYRVLNGTILGDLGGGLKFRPQVKGLREGTRGLVTVPFSRTTRGLRRISVFLPKFVNLVIRRAYGLSFSDYKAFVLDGLSGLFDKFRAILI